MLAAVVLAATATTAVAQVSPRAPCQDARPSEATCCYTNTSSAVMGGIDFVDLASGTQGQDAPRFGVPDYTTELNGYDFWFLSSENVAAFEADPWSYAPAWGGF